MKEDQDRGRWDNNKWICSWCHENHHEACDLYMFTRQGFFRCSCICNKEVKIIN